MLMSARLSIHDLMFIIQNMIRGYILHHYCDTPIWILVAKAMFEVEKKSIFKSSTYLSFGTSL